MSSPPKSEQTPKINGGFGLPNCQNRFQVFGIPPDVWPGHEVRMMQRLDIMSLSTLLRAAPKIKSDCGCAKELSWAESKSYCGMRQTVSNKLKTIALQASLMGGFSI